MKAIGVAVALVAGTLALGAFLWLRERRAKTVYPASQAAALLHPARRFLQRPRELVATFGIGPGHRVLELGPGPGYFTAEAAAATGPGGLVISADLQPAMLAELRHHLPVDAATRVRVVAADATRLPLADESFDRAFVVAMLGEVPEPERAIAELRRVLRPGGIAAFCETLTDPDYVRESVLRGMCARGGLPFLDRRHRPLGYVMRFTRP